MTIGTTILFILAGATFGINILMIQNLFSVCSVVNNELCGQWWFVGFGLGIPIAFTIVGFINHYYDIQDSRLISNRKGMMDNE